VSDPTARAFVGVGSNLQPFENVGRAVALLAGAQGVILSGISTFYRTAALPDPARVLQPTTVDNSDPDFLNGVLEIRTHLTPVALLDLLADVERSLGRERSENRYRPRTMDLDLLLYGRIEPEQNEPVWEEIGTPGILVHRDIERRAFVAHPLLELDPDLVLPPHRIPLRALASSFETPGGVAEPALTEELRRRFL